MGMSPKACKGFFLVNARCKVITINSDLPEEIRRIILAHELGHALGLYHHDDPEALMYPVLGKQNLQHFQLRPADKTLLYHR